jgi:hypothetical protein
MINKLFAVFEKTTRIESDERGQYQRVILKGIERNLSWKEAKELRKINKNHEIFPQ